MARQLTLWLSQEAELSPLFYFTILGIGQKQPFIKTRGNLRNF
jgi:hypothetical protein